MKIGYARVSTFDQNIDAQLDALLDAGCKKIFQEKVTGARYERTELNRLLEILREGDIVVVWKLDRLSRSLKDLLFIMEKIHEREATFLSLTETLDTTSAGGKMMMQMIGSFSEFERSLLRERTKQGLLSARKHGRIGGRKSKFNDFQKEEINKLLEEGEKSRSDIARLFNVNPSTISRFKTRSVI